MEGNGASPLRGRDWQARNPGLVEKLYDLSIDVTFDLETGARTDMLTGFASLPNGLVRGPDGALYTSNQGFSFTPGDGGALRIVP